ncbi:MAG: hypothetical protein ACYDGO_14525 [Smithellaceae bacterium]
MKRIILSAMVLVMLLASIGGCFVPWHEDGRDGRGPRHHRDGGYDRGPGHDRDSGPVGPGGYDRDGERH